MALKSGEVSWDEELPSDNKFVNAKDLFLRLDRGNDNELRIITPPFQYLSHKYKREGDSGFGQKVHCSAEHGSCPLCALGDKAKPRWLFGVISRKTNSYKIFDISTMVFQQLKKLTRNPRWGVPTAYDIQVIVDENGGATGYYTVQPIPKEPLSPEDQKIRDSVDLADLKRRVAAPTPDKVLEKMARIDAGPQGKAQAKPAGKPVATKAATKPVVKQEVKQEVAESSDEEDMTDFPSYTT